MSDKKHGIRNISDLREHALEAIGQLDRGEIDVVQAGVTGKLYETVISSLKTQIAYAHLNGEGVNIPFLETEKTLINAEKPKLLSTTKKLANKSKKDEKIS